MNERAPGGETRGFLATVDVLHRVMSPRCSDDPCVCTPQERERLADAANDVCNALGALTPGEGYCDRRDEIGCSICGRDREALREKLAELQQTFNHDDERDEIDTWALLIRLLDEHYPPDVFPGGPTADPGPRIVGLIRAVDELRAEIVHLATYKESATTLARRFDQVYEVFGMSLDTPWPELLATIRRQHQMLQCRQEERSQESGAPDDLEYRRPLPHLPPRGQDSDG